MTAYVPIDPRRFRPRRLWLLVAALIAVLVLSPVAGVAIALGLTIVVIVRRNGYRHRLLAAASGGP